jgi:hypothetical protein
MKSSSKNVSEDDLILRKNKGIERLPYLKQEANQTFETETALAFAITLFNVCFMYNGNITVVNKFSKKVVYSQNFREEKILRGINLDTEKNQLLAFCPQKLISFAHLKGEDNNEWRRYLKTDFEKAIFLCKSAKQRAQAYGDKAD